MNKEVLMEISTEELDELLRQELEKEHPDRDVVLQIIRILEKRADIRPLEPPQELERPWAKKPPKRLVHPLGVTHRWALRAMTLAVAVCIAVVCLVPVEAKADSWWEKLTRWTDGFFELFNPGDSDSRSLEYTFTTDHEGLQEVYDAVTELGVTARIVPTWLPSGYTLDRCEVSHLQTKSVMCADFTAGDSVIIYQTEVFEQGVLRQYQKNDYNVAAYEIDGTTFHVMNNHNRWVAVWTNENVECSLSADCGEEDFYEILNSI